MIERRTKIRPVALPRASVPTNDPEVADWQRMAKRTGKYGITPKDYELLCDAQNDRCAICRRSFSRGILVVDHDHVTGAVRGLLCPGCNSGLGFFEDSTDRLLVAAAYLANPPAPTLLVKDPEPEFVVRRKVTDWRDEARNIRTICRQEQEFDLPAEVVDEAERRGVTVTDVLRERLTAAGVFDGSERPSDA